MSGTDIASGTAPYQSAMPCPCASGTEIAYGATLPPGMSGTEIAYGGPGARRRGGGTCVVRALSAYAPAAGCA
eukprot:2476658-Rhodomonas_salina.1